jgi:hypothetical protein
VTVKEFTDIFLRSDNKVIQSAARHMEWTRLRHSIDDLAILLANNIVHMVIGTKDGPKEVLACSNKGLVARYLGKAGKLGSVPSNMGKCRRRMKFVLAYDFIKNDYISVFREFNIVPGEWVTITTENVDLVNQVLKESLERH